MNRTLASADTAHYYQRPAQLSTLPATPPGPVAAGPPATTAGPAASGPAGPDPGRAACPPGSGPAVAGSDPNARAGDRCPHRTQAISKGPMMTDDALTKTLEQMTAAGAAMQNGDPDP